MLEELKILGYNALLEYDTKAKIKFKRIRAGSFSPTTGKISIPMWAIDKGKEYTLYYILHEVTHAILDKQIGNGWGHGEDFKELETSLLKKYGMIPVYKKAYISKLLSENGTILYEKKPKRRKRNLKRHRRIKS